MIREIVINDFDGWCSAMGNLCPVICCHALVVLKEQESIIESLKSDLAETLNVVTNRKNVTHCKDCKYWSAERINDFNKCRRWINVGVKNFATMGDWFCADGIPKEVK